MLGDPVDTTPRAAGGKPKGRQARPDPFKLALQAEKTLLEVYAELRDRLKQGGHLLNAHQIILLGAMDDNITIGDIKKRGYYAATNPSHNIEQLVEQGYLEKERVAADRRVHRVKRTEKAAQVVVLARPFLMRLLIAAGLTEA